MSIHSPSSFSHDYVQFYVDTHNVYCRMTSTELILNDKVKKCELYNQVKLVISDNISTEYEYKHCTKEVKQ